MFVRKISIICEVKRVENGLVFFMGVSKVFKLLIGNVKIEFKIVRNVVL